ncbi:hypothetical protein [Wenzhouxiangella sediminis]|uniref:Uncharacterized protein n=1 Tax=Wenzhouxiangella sediminis TaxID=1792836 RepID=A0A3E1K8Q6_9GAMM|nr:hypothetical protein [Wenzhouxiangella sediminis]RFF30366.1 hypothetical protein DZC52_08625 [Wenzhouxiangella sediminis]
MDLLSQDSRTFLLGVSVTIAIFMMLFAIRNRIRDHRVKLEVAHGFSHQLIQEAGEFLPGSTAFLYVEIKNCGEKQRFIEKPALKLSEKIDGENAFYITTVNDPHSWPQKLEPGAVFKKETNLRNLHQKLTSKISRRAKLRFEVRDTLGKTYKSKWFKMADVIGQLQVEESV